MIYHLTAGPFMHPKFNNPLAKKIHKQHPSRCRAESAAEGRVTRHRPMLPMHRVFEPVEAAKVAARVAGFSLAASLEWKYFVGNPGAYALLLEPS